MYYAVGPEMKEIQFDLSLLVLIRMKLSTSTSKNSWQVVRIDEIKDSVILNNTDLTLYSQLKRMVKSRALARGSIFPVTIPPP